jgi:hypothetical protein
MVEYILAHIGEIASILTITGAFYAAVTRGYNKLHKEMMLIHQDCKEAHARIDAAHTRIDAAIAAINASTAAINARSDDMNKRIDNSYNAFMAVIAKG